MNEQKRKFIFEYLCTLGTEVAHLLTRFADGTSNTGHNLANGYFMTRFRNSSLAEVLRNQDVDRELAPSRWDLNVLHLKNSSPIGIFNLRSGLHVFDGVQRMLS